MTGKGAGKKSVRFEAEDAAEDPPVALAAGA